MLNIIVTAVAPVGEVSEGEADMVIQILKTVIDHMTVDVATAVDLLAARLQADPIFSNVATFGARCRDTNLFELFRRGNVLGCAMLTIFFWAHCVETFDLQTRHVRVLIFDRYEMTPSL